MPSLARIPIAVPAWEMASRAYSTWYNRPSGEKIVVCVEDKRLIHVVIMVRHGTPWKHTLES